MSNYYDPYNPIFYAQEGLIVLESALGMIRRIHRGYDHERKSANIGDTIRIRKPGTFTTQAGGNGTVNDLTPTQLDLVVDNWREVKFGLTDQELAYTSDKIIQEHISPAMYALAHYMETQVTNMYCKVPWHSILSGTIVSSDIVNARKVLRDNAGGLVDTDQLHFAFDSTVEAALLNMTLFHSASVAGDQNKDALMRGSLGTRFGVEHFVQQTLTSHAAGTVVTQADGDSDKLGALVGAHLIRATTISVDGLDADPGTQTLKSGDSLVIAGHTQRYVVTATTTLTAGAHTAIPIYPALVQAYDNDAVVTFETPGTPANYADAYFANIMFHKNAFAFAMAPLPMIGDGAGAKMAVVTDPRTGLSIRSRLAYDDQYGKVKVTLDVLFGVKCLDPNLAVIVRRDYA